MVPAGSDKTGVSSQAISVPQGSGKVQGMGESFSTQLSTGVASFTVPFALVPARGAAQPSLSLSYSSASGNGVAGVGWNVGVAFIARQTDRGLPGYIDPSGGWQPTQDRFVFNGGQELVPICLVSGATCAGALPGEQLPSWATGWQYFRPRVEGSFLRFFWSPDHNTWRVQSKTGTSMELGVPLDDAGYTSALEQDPAGARTFRWNLVREYDAYLSGGRPVNPVVYRYVQDGGMAYLSDVYDTPPAASPVGAALSSYAHHAHLLYEERPDATFSYRRGWQVTQGLRLSGVDVTSASFAVSGARELTRRYHLAYDASYHLSLLASVQTEGRCAQAITEDSTGALPGVTGCPTLPPMTFDYQHVAPYDTAGNASTADVPGWEGFDERVHSMANSPNHSLDESLTDLFDINADGLPDVMVTAPYLYGSNDAVFLNGQAPSGAALDSFSPAQCVTVQGVPGEDTNAVRLDNPNVTALDIDGDGIVNLINMPIVETYSVYSPLAPLPPPKGSGCWAWQGHPVTTASQQNAKLDFQQYNANIKVMDVNDDGVVDVVFSAGTEYQTFFSLDRFPGDPTQPSTGLSGDGQFGSATWTSATTASISNGPVTSCLPWDATPPMLGDSDVHVADMNGDHLPDIVRVRPGDVRYWPGRGNGYWGTGDPSNCPGGTFDQAMDVVMTSSPQIGVVDSTESLRVDDVNGDGLDDIVKVEFETVYVWLNVGGTSWAGPHIIQGSPPRSPVVDRVRLVDANGSGTRDVLYGDGNAYRYMDLNGGSRPWVLTHVANGLGKTTDIEYGTSTEQMVADAAAGQPWSSVAPMPIEVVTQVAEKDNLELVGQPGGTYVTQYAYRDPVYDGRQREFRGFTSATATRIGDANSPSSTTSSTFLLGQCVNDENETPDPCTEEGRWEDNPREALKGLPLASDTYDATGNYLSTAHHTYRLRKLYTGLDGREVRYAFESQSDSYAYDDGPFTSGAQTATLTDVELETTLGSVQTDTTGSLTLHSTAGRAHLHRSSIVDPFGNATASTDDGCVDGCAAADESITSNSVPSLVPGDASGWMYRTVESFVTGSLTSGRRKDTTMQYDPGGNPVLVQAALAGTVQLDRFHEDPTAEIAPSPATQSSDGTLLVSTQKYDALGRLIQ
ncbi:MAG: toxin TcdB middle/N-terminal domain-containing protein, partial [Polyangiaceae bacterium]